MPSTADRLQLTLNTKNAIKEAIRAKDVEVADTDPFSTYPDKILSIAGGVAPDFKNNPDAYAGVVGIDKSTSEFTVYYLTNSADIELIAQGFSDFNTPYFDFAALPVTPISLYFAPKVEELDITQIGNYFLTYYHYEGWDNQIGLGLVTVDGLQYFTKVTALGDNFMAAPDSGGMGGGGNQIAFNSPLNLPPNLLTIGRNFLYRQANFNQPVNIPDSVTSIGASFLQNCSSFNSPVHFSTSLTTLGDYPLSQNQSFNQEVVFPSSLTAIPQGVLYYDLDFNQPITIPEGVTSIGRDFLSNCSVFNSALTLPSTLTTIGPSFLYSAYAFAQPLTIPASVTSIGEMFMAYTTQFTGPLTVNTSNSPTDNSSISTGSTSSPAYTQGVTLTGPAAATWATNLPDRTSSPYRKLLALGDYGTLTYVDDSGAEQQMALVSLSDFNALTEDYSGADRVLQFSTGSIAASSVKGYTFGSDFPSVIPSGFLDTVPNLTNPIAFPEGVEELGDRCLYSCSNFNSAVSLPSTLRTIGAHFLGRCSLYNQPITLPEGLRSIGDRMLEDTAFDQTIMLPNSLTSLGADFLTGTPFNRPLVLPPNVGPLHGLLVNCTKFNQPITIPAASTIGFQFLSGCTSFDSQVTIENGVTSIGNSFLQNCSVFNQPLVIPPTVTSIGSSFLNKAHMFAQSLTLPASVTEVGNYFMCDAYAFTGPLLVEGAALPSHNDEYSLSVDEAHQTSPMYATGVTVQGPYANYWGSYLPNITYPRYRKLIIGTTS